MCDWSPNYDDSEWSLMTSPIRLLGVPFESSAGRSLREMCLLIDVVLGPPLVPIHEVHPDEAMFRDGNF